MIQVTLTPAQVQTLSRLTREGAVPDPSIPFVVTHKGRTLSVDPEGRCEVLGDIIK